MTPPPTPPPTPPGAPDGGRSRRLPRFARHTENRVVAGVCAGIARSIGVDPLVVRVAFVAFALAGGVGVVLYLVAWGAASEDAEAEIAAITRQQTLAVGLVALGVLLLLRDLGLWFGDRVALPVTIAAIGSAVIYARADDADRVRWGAFADRIPGRSAMFRTASPVRLIVGTVLIAIGMTSVLATTNALLALRSVGLAVVVAVLGIGLVFGPWIASLVGELGAERRERIRSEERAEVAAHLHDSVLQTLALIQRSAHEPRRMVALARSQERELRAWLYGNRDLGDVSATLRGMLDEVLVHVESAHDLDVDLVVVGDAPLDDDLRALVAAVREALMNAGAHAGVSTASVYVEVEDESVTAFVRDRGAGFDPAGVGDDRRGVADSIRGRVRRHGGTALLTTAPGEGTEWELTIRRRTPRSDDAADASPDPEATADADVSPDSGPVASPEADAAAARPTATVDPSWPAPSEAS